MHTARRLAFAAAAVALIALGSAGSPSGSTGDLEANRRLLQDLRANDPDRYDRLRRNHLRFRDLPPERQEQLRQLDRQLRDEDTQTQARLLRALGEYAAWLTRLPEEQRRRVLAAGSTEERLAVIRELREQEWFARLPQALQDEYQAAPAERRPELLAKWRREEQQRAREWADARRSWPEFADRPAMVRPEELNAFVVRKLVPMLSPDDQARLAALSRDPDRGNFMMLTRLVAELADRHPVLALEQHAKYPTFESLPPAYKDAVRRLPRDAAQRLQLSPNQGRWPAFAVEVVEQLRRAGVAVPAKPLGPARAAEFGPAVEEFVRQHFTTDADRARLQAAEGRWPDYPRLLHELAREHKVAIPELSLPGDPRRWDMIRNRRPGPAALPEPPPELLRKFVAEELNQQDPNGPRLSLMDPQDREVIKQKFFEANPKLLETLRALDREKRGRGGFKGRPPGND